MTVTKGVFVAKTKSGTIYYRSSFTYRTKHISLGSYESEKEAGSAYREALNLVQNDGGRIEDYNPENYTLPFTKYVTILNFKDNGLYIKTPIYIRPKYFEYYLDGQTVLKFDVDDLFYYSNHKIMKRNKHLFVSDYGMQVSLLSRYGIKNYAIEGKDYSFINGDNTDFRYINIKIINKYNGVSKNTLNGRDVFTTKIHIKGVYIVGRYSTEIDAAIAYNKAADVLKSKGVAKNFTYNYIEDINSIEYASKYNAIRISKKIRNYT